MHDGCGHRTQKPSEDDVLLVDVLLDVDVVVDVEVDVEVVVRAQSELAATNS